MKDKEIADDLKNAGYDLRYDYHCHDDEERAVEQIKDARKTMKLHKIQWHTKPH